MNARVTRIAEAAILWLETNQRFETIGEKVLMNGSSDPGFVEGNQESPIPRGPPD
jgi:hypothetical protein